MNNNEPLIHVQDLQLGYDGKTLVEGLSFDVFAGNYLCIVGENGSGKTTLMRTLLGLQAPMAGTIRFGGDLRADQIGYLPQQTQVQRDFPASVMEVVLSGCLDKGVFHPFYTRAERERAMENIRRMELQDLTQRSYRELSGGQQQRVLLARALCAAQRILLLDEPVSGLDPHVTAEMYQVIRRLNEEGVTIMMISHDVQEAVPYASHILHVGRRIFFGTREEYEREVRNAD